MKNNSSYYIIIIIFSVSSIINCFRLPEENLILKKIDYRKKIDKPFLIVFKYTINSKENFLENLPTHDLSNIQSCIRNSFEKYFLFSNLKILPESENISYLLQYSNPNLNIINIHIDEKYQYKTLSSYNNPPPLTAVTLGVIPSFEIINFSIHYSGNRVIKNENMEFNYRFRNYYGWFLIPYSFFWNQYIEFNKNTKNNERNYLEFIITKSLENIDIQE